MSIITTFNPQFDFWSLHPELENIEEFKDIKIKYKKNSSDVMWFIAHTFDIGPDNKFKNLEFDDRVLILSKDIVKDKDFWKNNESKLQDAITIFIKISDTPAYRHKRQLVETLDKRTEFLKNTDYSLDNYDKLDKMIANTKAIFQTLEEVDKLIEKEQGGSTTKGGYIPSLSDMNDI